ncbi:MAG: hypothetical protein ACOC56_01710 [Atribacterota bacterium]
MNKTESIVVQVAPQYENTKIKEMEQFGWNLQGRQEMHEEGEAEGRESLLGGSYIITTKVSHYVKMHFTRDTNLPNISKIKELESEYFNLPFPSLPRIRSYIWPLLLIIFGIIGLNPDTLVAGIFLIGLGGLWLLLKINKHKKNSNTCRESFEKQQELISEVQTLT